MKSQGAKLSFSSVSVRGGRAGAFACLGKQEPGVGLHPEPAACVRYAGTKKTQCASCPPQARVRARRGEEKTRCASCSPQARGFFLLSFAFSCLAFCLSKFFSLVAHAATGISLLVPSRGFVPGLRVLSPAAFSRTFAPIACFSVLRCSRGFSPFFCPFLPNFFLSNFFSFVAQAATGLYFLPKRK